MPSLWRVALLMRDMPFLVSPSVLCTLQGWAPNCNLYFEDDNDEIASNLQRIKPPEATDGRKMCTQAVTQRMLSVPPS